ncbi:uncharacterized protein PFLUO_LOCUS5596 [Penicillium psychrofluorescens]|uniref:uncharacterized protein n=1 Tax=Penicillium psychrofluorescens TaxID=3158075 RepID=UPI003CCCB6EF
MASGFSATPRKEGSWTKLVIFAALYALLLESVAQWVLVLYLYGKGLVDSKMTVSVVLALVASFLSIPLAGLQSLVAWQYNKIGGFGTQKSVLHNLCTYFYRLDLMAWLATSVSGLVVVAQQVDCLPGGTDASMWRVGLGCYFLRASVVVSVVSLVTVCTIYCARELCERPYDISLIGIYTRQPTLRDDSIFSGHSWDSDETLKNEILNLCRQHDGTIRGEWWSPDPLAAKVNCHPSIRQPAPVRLRPQLHLNTDPGSECGEIVPCGTTVSPDENYPHISPGGQSAVSGMYPISRTSTLMVSPTGSESRGLISGSSSVPKVPAIPEQYTTKHKRGKSSISSFRRFLPKAFPLFLPLSLDPQIRALADPNAASDVEKQVATPSIAPHSRSGSAVHHATQTSPDTPATPTRNDANSKTQSLTAVPDSNERTMTMNSADAPEVVPSEITPTVKRSQTACLAARSIHHPHHPNYVAGPPTNPQSPAQPAFSARTYSLSWRQQSGTVQMDRSMTRSNTRATTALTQPPHHHHPQHYIRGSTSAYPFDQTLIPRHTQSQHHPPPHYMPDPRRRVQSQRHFDASRVVPVPGPIPGFPMPPVAAAPRRNDVEVIYPSSRRPRSTTFGAIGSVGPLSCIMESTSTPRASADESQLSASADAMRTYRGANRTSLGFY